MELTSVQVDIAAQALKGAEAYHAGPWRVVSLHEGPGLTYHGVLELKSGIWAKDGKPIALCLPFVHDGGLVWRSVRTIAGSKLEPAEVAIPKQLKEFKQEIESRLLEVNITLEGFRYPSHIEASDETHGQDRTAQGIQNQTGDRGDGDSGPASDRHGDHEVRNHAFEG